MISRLTAIALAMPFAALTVGSAEARSFFSIQADSRTEFIRQCTTHMTGRWAHPDAVCGCLHDHAAAAVPDVDLREALLRGISESGVPNIQTDWVPPAKQAQISATFTLIAKPTLQCMFDPQQ